MRSEAQTRWEKGVDPEAAALAATYASQLLAELAGARWTGETEVRAEPAPAPVIAYRPQYASATVGLEIAGGRAARAARPARLRGRPTTGRSRVPTWRARDVRRDIDVVEEVGAVPARGRAGDAAATAGDVRPADARAAAAAPRRGRARRRRDVRGVHLLAAARRSRSRTRSSCPSRCRRSSASCARRSRSACSVRRSTTSTWGTATSRSSRSRTSTCRPARCPRSAGGSAGSCRATSSGRKGLVEAVFEALHVEPTFDARRSRATSWSVAATVQSGWVATYAPGVGPDGEWSAFELDLDGAVRARAGADPLPRRDHVPAASPGSRVRRRRGRPGRRPDRGRARGGRRGAARGAVPVRLPRRPDPGRARSRSRSRSRSSRRSARSRTTTRAPSRGAAIVSELSSRFGAGAAAPSASRSERETNLLDARDLSIARRVTTKRPLVRNRGAGTQLRVATTHRFGVTVNRRTYARARAFESRSTTVTPFAASSHTRKRA